ncbi:hypothetical protein CRG98_014411 [Punica granatum]|uniref:Uncharacterized protein n=1 Tax=Punica granatum TaxID=22663 RepID=A0A2I0K9P0_PUNGR|nr:hypothetical protein CRG98_014411 [Punica granatum]
MAGRKAIDKAPRVVVYLDRRFPQPPHTLLGDASLHVESDVRCYQSTTWTEILPVGPTKKIERESGPSVPTEDADDLIGGVRVAGVLCGHQRPQWRGQGRRLAVSIPIPFRFPLLD